MKTLLSLCLAVFVSLNTFAADSPDDAKAIQGLWKPSKAELGGKPMDEAVVKIISLKMDDGKYEVFVGTSPDRGTYTIDTTTKPKSITVNGTEGPNNGKTFPAIY